MKTILKKEIKKVSQPAASVTSHHGFERGCLGEKGGGAWFGILTDELIIPSHFPCGTYTIPSAPPQTQSRTQPLRPFHPATTPACVALFVSRLLPFRLGRAWLDE